MLTEAEAREGARRAAPPPAVGPPAAELVVGNLRLRWIWRWRRRRRRSATGSAAGLRGLALGLNVEGETVVVLAEGDPGEGGLWAPPLAAVGPAAPEIVRHRRIAGG